MFRLVNDFDKGEGYQEWLRESSKIERISESHLENLEDASGDDEWVVARQKKAVFMIERFIVDRAFRIAAK